MSLRIPPGTPSEADPAVAIILVNWNNWRDCIECIDSVAAQNYANFHIFVVDNDSADQSIERIAEWCSKPQAMPSWRRHEGVDRITDSGGTESIMVRIADRPSEALPHAPAECRITLIRSGSNLGFAGGCNVGIRAAGLDSFHFFWLLNCDSAVHRDALKALTHRALRNPTIGIVGSTVRYYDTPEVVQALGGARFNPATASSWHIGLGSKLEEIPGDPTQVEHEMVYVFGASMLVSSRFVRDIGLMQEDYFLYFEEFDWAMRGRGRYTLGYAPDSHVFHKSGASSSKVMPAFTANLYYRNRIRFMSRFFPGFLPATNRGLTLELFRFAMKGNWRQARVIASVLWNARQIASQAMAKTNDS